MCAEPYSPIIDLMYGLPLRLYFMVPFQQTTNSDPCEFAGELPVKNPNSNLPPGVYRGEEGGGSSSGVGETFTDGAAFGQLKTEGGPLFPPSYSDLFDKHDPAVQGKK